MQEILQGDLCSAARPFYFKASCKHANSSSPLDVAVAFRWESRAEDKLFKIYLQKTKIFLRKPIDFIFFSIIHISVE